MSAIAKIAPNKRELITQVTEGLREKENGPQGHKFCKCTSFTTLFTQRQLIKPAIWPKVE